MDLSGRALIEYAGLGADVEVVEVLRTHSFNLTLAEVLKLAAVVLEEIRTPGVDGVVVTHGTDTMEETAFLLDLLLRAHETVVLTGAQRHAGEADSDGPRNLADAVRVAGDPGARGLGAVIVMAGRIHPARTVRKAHTVAADAFASPDGGPIGAVDVTGPRVWSRPVRAPGFRLDELGSSLARVDVVSLHLDADDTQLVACVAAGAHGIVLAALGAGNPTPAVLRTVAACVRDGIPVLVTSRCGAGPAVPVYGAGGGADLAAAGAVFAGDLGSAKARLLLAAALTAEPTPAAALHRVRASLVSRPMEDSLPSSRVGVPLSIGSAPPNWLSSAHGDRDCQQTGGGTGPRRSGDHSGPR
ncbi:MULTISPECIES: asparaginase [unclassified Kribbella]|uniref:asparaginase n=1 Tax=unclassified Kribbella TaxID=2644121 RepID=UPI003078A139